MKSISKVTTTYNPVQDRVCLSGALSDKSVALLWLTRPMLDRLVPQLLEWLAGVDADADMPRGDLMQSFKQQSAARKMPAAGPVAGEEATADWLVTALDIQKSTERLRLVFRAPDQHEEKVVLDLAALPLRQWLNILLVAYRKGGWPDGVWPEWMLEQLDVERPASAPLH